MDFKTVKGVKTAGILGIFLIIVAGVMLVAYPLFTQSQKHAEQISMSQSELQASEAKLATLRAQKESIDKVETLDDELSKKFPAYADTPGLINSISQAASEAGMGAGNINDLTAGIPTIISAPAAENAVGAENAPAPDPAAAPAPGATATSNIAEMTIDISLEGSVDELSDFVVNLSELERNFTVLTFNLSTEGEGGSTATIQAKSYIYKEIPKIAEEAPVAETPAAEAPASEAAAETPAE